MNPISPVLPESSAPSPDFSKTADSNSIGSVGSSSPGYFERHIFFCLNQRQPGEECCATQGAQAGFDHCKSRIKAAKLSGPGQVRVNKAGCLDRCSGGPVAVVYPEGVWYSFVDSADIDEIVDTHLIGGKVVDRLVMPADVGR